MKKDLENVVYELMEFIKNDILEGDFIPECFGDFHINECKACNSYNTCKNEIEKREKLKGMINAM